MISANTMTDDVLITETGYDDLTSTPKTVEEVESLLSS
jgi:hypothetical protein